MGFFSLLAFCQFYCLATLDFDRIYLVNQVGPWQLLFFLVTFIFSDAFTFWSLSNSDDGRTKRRKRKQNAKLNLFLAENERNRIGQDLHDSLGHTFAMLSVKTDLAIQLLQMQAYPQAEKN